MQRTIGKADGNAAVKPSAKAAAGKAAAGKAKAPVKVKLTKRVVDKVAALNADGRLSQELRLGAVGVRLAELSEADALEVLDAVLDDPSGRDDPITFVRIGCKALQDEKKIATEREAQAIEAGHMDDNIGCAMDRNSNDPFNDSHFDMGGDALNEPDELEEAQVLVKDFRVSVPEEVEARAADLRKHGKLKVQLESDAKCSAVLSILGELPALEVLNEAAEACGDKSVGEQVDFITDMAGSVVESMRGTIFATRLSRRVRYMNACLGFAAPLHMGRVVEALGVIGEDAALLVLKRLVRHVADDTLREDPTEWVVEHARMVRFGDVNANP